MGSPFYGEAATSPISKIEQGANGRNEQRPCAAIPIGNGDQGRNTDRCFSSVVRVKADQSPLSLSGSKDHPSFLSCRRSLEACANSQSRNVTIFGTAAVAFGQMIQ